MKCQICNNPTESIKIGQYPITGYRCDTLQESLNQPKFEMILVLCNNCGMVNYLWYDEASPILNKLYSDHNSTYYDTNELTRYISSFADNIIERYKLNKDSNILEIGCNDGSLLSLFRQKSGCNIIGVEPSKQFHQYWDNQNILVFNEYFSTSLAKRMQHQKYDLIIFRHVFEHIPNPLEFFNALKIILSDNTVVVLEVPYLVSIINSSRIENISYSHLNFFTLSSISKIAYSIGLHIIYDNKVDTDGGSIVCHLSKNTELETTLKKEGIDDIVTKPEVESLLNKIDEISAKLKDELKDYSKHEIVGYGAGAKGQQLIHFLNLGKYLFGVIDDTPESDGKFIPGTGIQIYNSTLLTINADIKVVINLAPTHTETIKNKIPSNLTFINLV